MEHCLPAITVFQRHATYDRSTFLLLFHVCSNMVGRRRTGVPLPGEDQYPSGLYLPPVTTPCPGTYYYSHLFPCPFLPYLVCMCVEGEGIHTACIVSCPLPPPSRLLLFYLFHVLEEGGEEGLCGMQVLPPWRKMEGKAVGDLLTCLPVHAFFPVPLNTGGGVPIFLLVVPGIYGGERERVGRCHCLNLCSMYLTVCLWCRVFPPLLREEELFHSFRVQFLYLPSSQHFQPPSLAGFMPPAQDNLPILGWIVGGHCCILLLTYSSCLITCPPQDFTGSTHHLPCKPGCSYTAVPALFEVQLPAGCLACHHLDLGLHCTLPAFAFPHLPCSAVMGGRWVVTCLLPILPSPCPCLLCGMPMPPFSLLPLPPNSHFMVTGSTVPPSPCLYTALWSYMSSRL